ncbi:MAG: hypothetical protein WAS33_21315 [Candidatus Promineifilaceae bacterium]
MYPRYKDGAHSTILGCLGLQRRPFLPTIQAEVITHKKTECTLIKRRKRRQTIVPIPPTVDALIMPLSPVIVALAAQTLRRLSFG